MTCKKLSIETDGTILGTIIKADGVSVIGLSSFTFYADIDASVPISVSMAKLVVDGRGNTKSGALSESLVFVDKFKAPKLVNLIPGKESTKVLKDGTVSMKRKIKKVYSK
jgi:hypothetical protein